ncbi:MAG: DUF6582 domain-containing protein [Acidiferrobacterales bacterium]
MKATAVKFASGAVDVLDILAVPFDSPLPGGKDTDGEFFSDNTDLCLDWFPVERPLLFGHGLDAGPGVSVVGRVDSATARKEVDGWWVQAQLDASNRFYDSIKALIEQGKLFASSGAMPHLVKRGKGGELQRWPWVELSLTPTPANLYAVVEPADVAKHYKSAGLAFGKAELDAAATNALDDRDFAYIDSDGGRHLPIQDAAHCRAAMSRFSQTKFGSDADKAAAAKKILAAAKKLDIEVSDDSDVAEAAAGKAAKPSAHTAMRSHFHTHADGTEHTHAHNHAAGQSSHDGDGGKHQYKAVKADMMMPDPEQVPADGDDGDAPEGSCEDWLQDLNRLLNRGLGGPFGDAYAYTVATFGCNGPGYSIVCVGQYDYDDYSNDSNYYRVEFTADDQTEPVLGAVTPMERVYIPAKSTGLNSAEPLILAATTAIKDATVVCQRTRGLAERRIKEGRVLSAANVQRLQALQKSLTAAAGEIEDLLGSATPPAKAATPALLQLLDLRTRQSRLRLVD